MHYEIVDQITTYYLHLAISHGQWYRLDDSLYIWARELYNTYKGVS